MVNYKRKRPTFAHLFTVFTILIFNVLGCQTVKESSTDDSTFSTSAVGKPYFGFNTKATLTPAVQVKMIDDFLGTLSENVKENIVFRVPGGTLSQKVYSSDFSDADIALWASLQTKHKVRFIYVVNGNDTPANQRELIERWKLAGVNFDFIEMMNEYYLPKYAKGKMDKKEVTAKVTPEMYVNEILPTFFEQLDALDLPYFVIFAPEKPGRGGERLADWNDAMVTALNEHFKSRNLGIAIHLYRRDIAASYDYSQINRLRNRIGANTKVAVTEMGVLDPSLTEAQAAQPTVDHYAKIFQELGEGDYMFDQVIFNDYGKSDMATLHPSKNGLTLKGEKVTELIKEIYK